MLPVPCPVAPGVPCLALSFIAACWLASLLGVSASLLLPPLHAAPAPLITRPIPSLGEAIPVIGLLGYPLLALAFAALSIGAALFASRKERALSSTADCPT